MGNRVTAERNREILAAIEAGVPLDRICREYRLSSARIREIVMDEKCRRRFSPDPFYRAWRSA